MTQTFESLLLDIIHNVNQSATPSELTTALYDAIKRAEDYEEEWITSLHDHSVDGYESFVY